MEFSATGCRRRQGALTQLCALTKLTADSTHFKHAVGCSQVSFSEHIEFSLDPEAAKTSQEAAPEEHSRQGSPGRTPAYITRDVS